MEHAEASHFLRDGVVMLGFALGFVLLFRRLTRMARDEVDAWATLSRAW